MSTLKAWRLNEYEVWAAETLEEAVKMAMRETGCAHHEIYDEAFAGEQDLSVKVRLEEDPIGEDEFTTVGELLEEQGDHPGLLCAWES